MPILTPDEIYRAARAAGFSPNASVTMTAIAMSESGGDTMAHNPNGEDSRGLWQINQAVHKWAADLDLTDPVQNAQAAFRISGEGRDISRWTVTHSANKKGARYLEHLEVARAAAVKNGDVWATGQADAPVNYDDRTPAAPSGTPAAADPISAGSVGAPSLAPSPGVPAGSETRVQQFLREALAQKGNPYVFGTEVRMDDPDPESFDCAELVEWAASRVGVEITDGSWLQYRALHQKGASMSVEEALRTPGALLFSFSSDPLASGSRPSQAHVAISLGNGQTIEARGTKWGVGTFDAESRFKYAAVIPELGTPLPPDVVPDPVSGAFKGWDHDNDGLATVDELLFGTDPNNAHSMPGVHDKQMVLDRLANRASFIETMDPAISSSLPTPDPLADPLTSLRSDPTPLSSRDPSGGLPGEDPTIPSGGGLHDPTIGL